MRRLFSVDDHICEPPDTWTSRVPAKYRDRAPHVVRDDDGSEYWVFEDQRAEYLGLNAVAGKPEEEWDTEPASFSDMIPGCYDPAARARDFAEQGIMSSLSFPTLPRFGGALFIDFKDKVLADVCVQTWNDFMFDWCSVAPQMYVPMSIVQLWDPPAAAKEIERNLARGVRAITMPEQTGLLGLPSYFTDFYDPIWAVCEEAGIPVCMHIASSGWRPYTPPEAPMSLTFALGMVPTQVHAIGMMFGPVCRKFPNLKIVYSEGGVSWVPAALERADFIYRKHKHWSGADDILPSEICRRNMWFCMIDEPFGLENRHTIGIDRLFWECDYPHSSCNWPGTQKLVDDLFVDVPQDEFELMAYKNANAVFNWDCPEVGTDVLAASSR